MGKRVKLMVGSVSHLSKVIRTCVKISTCPQAQVLFPLPSFHLLPFAWGLKLPRGVSRYTFPQSREALFDLLWREPPRCSAQVKGVRSGCHVVLRGSHAVETQHSSSLCVRLFRHRHSIPKPTTPFNHGPYFSAHSRWGRWRCRDRGMKMHSFLS